MASIPELDPLGTWFDGVAMLEAKGAFSAIDVAAAKSKEIAVVGAGMSGLMTYLVLDQAGMTNVTIIEAAQRLGGRVHTAYLSGGPFDYSYQEMGPMRFPDTYVDPTNNQTYNISDHQLVFQLADELNKLNGYNKNWSVDFIEWIQRNNNGLVYKNGFKLPTGLPPTVAEISANSSLFPSTVYDKATQELSAAVDDALPGLGSEFYATMAENMFKAHRQFIDAGPDGLPGDEWSEFSFMVNYLNGTLNSTDALSGFSDYSYWDALYEGLYFSSATTYFRTIDGGLNRLPEAFHPLVDGSTVMNRKIERVGFRESGKVELEWRDNFTANSFQGAEYDYAVVSVPFSIVRKWRMPSLPMAISNAINNIPYSFACKVALEYSERFWEQYENPIFGGCSTSTDIPGIGSICYPSYNLNSTGPASILASYISAKWGMHWPSYSEEEQVQYTLDAMTEIHGDFTRDLYTGNYNRRCWLLDEYQSGSWVSPTVGMHEQWIPEYFKTYNNMIFVGEHTSNTHAWISSALNSGIRGAIQLLLELGLVDEAKEANEKWMGRWIEV